MHKFVLYLYLAVSVLLFLLYWIDKRSAIAGGWRIKEKNLHLLAFIGGWPGAYLAQRVFRHKTKKMMFRNVFWGTVVANLAISIGIHTSTGGNAISVVTGLIKAI